MRSHPSARWWNGAVTNGTTDDVAPGARCWCRAEGVLWRLVPGSLVVLSPDDGAAPLSLTGPAVEAWDLLDRPLTTSELTEALAEWYGVDPAGIADEVDALVTSLVEQHLVTADR